MQKLMNYLHTYVGKSETRFNIRLNNHRKNMSSPKAILACVPFRKKGCNFIQHAKFTLMVQSCKLYNNK